MSLMCDSELILHEAEELAKAVAEYERVSIEKKRRAYQGEGYKPGIYDGLPQGATLTAIERKIIIIRERLNTLRQNLYKAGLWQ